ncbi:MAG: hypothetical protein HXS48_07220, partial [Theionarchaea archaeon]|nr:hypothetical protein [Theionarchaea archaeon]
MPVPDQTFGYSCYTCNISFSSTYSYAYPTEYSVTVGNDTITTKATYDFNRGWITSIQQPKGVDAGSGHDILYTYDLLGRVTKKEFPLLSGQSQRSYMEIVYDDTNIMATIIDPLRHYIKKQYDRLGRLTSIKWYTGIYEADPGNDTSAYTYDFLGRRTHMSFPDLTSVSYSYDDTNYNVKLTNALGFSTIYWYDWLQR